MIAILELRSVLLGADLGRSIDLAPILNDLCPSITSCGPALAFNSIMS